MEQKRQREGARIWEENLLEVVVVLLESQGRGRNYSSMGAKLWKGREVSLTSNRDDDFDEFGVFMINWCLTDCIDIKFDDFIYIIHNRYYMDTWTL